MKKDYAGKIASFLDLKGLAGQAQGLFCMEGRLRIGGEIHAAILSSAPCSATVQGDGHWRATGPGGPEKSRSGKKGLG